jgi:KipI family sensor histidine kinase inhibitor
VIRPFGEAALLVDTGDADRAQALAADLATRPMAAILGTVPGLRSLLVELDPAARSAGDVASELEWRLASLGSPAPVGRERRIRVLYGGEWGPDLADVASLTGLTEARVVELHASAPLRVLFDGFAPGFAYLGDLPDALHVPRLATPRTSTPAGSVAMAGAMSGIYPAALPGGWRVIGRTPIALFDPRREPPAYLAPGDVVSFEPMEAGDWERLTRIPDDW